jgi:hypothetical protein
MNQNLTVLWVCFITLKIMMDANRYHVSAIRGDSSTRLTS